MEFLVEFEVEVPAGTPDVEVEQHQRAEAALSAGPGHRPYERKMSPPASGGTLKGCRVRPLSRCGATSQHWPWTPS